MQVQQDELIVKNIKTAPLVNLTYGAKRWRSKKMGSQRKA
jgi:hypothetical protein